MLEFCNVVKQYRSGIFGTYLINAVNNVSFAIMDNERIGLLGESGCGKSTIAKLATKLLFPSKGQILFSGHDINKMSVNETKEFRKNVQIIFQNPQQVFNPRMKLYDTIAEPLRIYGLAQTRESERKVIAKYMSMFGLTDDILNRYPQEISGGQVQRIAIMRIIMLEPKLIIADEPTTMLDVSVQAQILELLKNVMDTNRSALLFVSHDLDVVRALCRKIIVMKEGKIIEIGDTEEVFHSPKHPYTHMLISSADSETKLKALARAGEEH